MDLLNLKYDDYWEFLAVLGEQHPKYTNVNSGYVNRRTYLLVKDRGGDHYLIDTEYPPPLSTDWVDSVIVSRVVVMEETREYYMRYGEKVYL